MQEAGAFIDAAHSLETWNSWLVRFGLEPAVSDADAKRKFRTIYCCIFDIIDGIFNDFGGIWKLRNYILRNKLFFPKKDAKDRQRKGGRVDVFLRQIWR